MNTHFNKKTYELDFKKITSNDLLIYLKETYPNITSKDALLFDPYMIEMSNHNDEYLRVARNIIGLEADLYKEYLTDTNKKDHLHNYIKNNIDTVNFKNPIVDYASKKYLEFILDKGINNGRDIEWFIKYFLYKRAQDNNVNLQVTNLDLKKYKEDMILADLNKESVAYQSIQAYYIHDNKTDNEIIRVKYHSFLGGPSFARIDELLMVCYHEFEHLLQKQKGRKDLNRNTYRYIKENFITAVDFKYYANNHDYFIKENEAFLESIKHMTNEITNPIIINHFITKNNTGFLNKIKNESLKEYELRTLERCSKKYFELTNHCDQIVSKNPDVLNSAPFLLIEYNQDGTRTMLPALIDKLNTYHYDQLPTYIIINAIRDFNIDSFKNYYNTTTNSNKKMILVSLKEETEEINKLIDKNNSLKTISSQKEENNVFLNNELKKLNNYLNAISFIEQKTI